MCFIRRPPHAHPTLTPAHTTPTLRSHRAHTTFSLVHICRRCRFIKWRDGRYDQAERELRESSAALEAEWNEQQARRFSL